MFVDGEVTRIFSVNTFLCSNCYLKRKTHTHALCTHMDVEGLLSVHTLTDAQLDAPNCQFAQPHGE